MSRPDTLRRIAGEEPGRTALVCLGLAGLVAAVYGRTLGFGFVYFDDNTLIFENPAVRAGLTLQGLKWAFDWGNGVTYWHPLTWLSLMLDVQISGLSPGAMHAANALLHAANAVLLFAFLRRASGLPWPSALAAALFAAHPLGVESVAWVTERKDVLSTLFWMLTLLAYARYAEGPSPRRYLPVLAAMAVGLTAKPMLVFLPVVLLGLDVWPLRRVAALGGPAEAAPIPKACPPVATSRLLLEKLPLLGLSILSVAVTTASHPVTGAALTDVPFSRMLANALVSYPTYALKMLWPVNLAAHYPFPQAVPALEVVGAGLFLAAGTALALLWIRRRPYVFAGWLWYGVALAPTLKLNRFGLWYSVADRFAYVPLIGLYALLAFGLAEAASARPRLARAAPAAAAAALLAFSAVAFVQVGYWGSTTALYERMLSVSPNDAFALNNYGNAMKAQGRIELAVGYYRDAIRADPRYQLPRYNLGLALQERGRLAEAAHEYRQALDIYPDSGDVLNNLGVVLIEIGQFAEAEARLAAAARLAPDDPKPYNNMGILRLRQKRVEEAAARFAKAVSLSPASPDRYANLAVALLMLGRTSEAREALLAALRLDPGFAPARELLARQGVGP